MSLRATRTRHRTQNIFDIRVGNDDIRVECDTASQRNKLIVNNVVMREDFESNTLVKVEGTTEEIEISIEYSQAPIIRYINRKAYEISIWLNGEPVENTYADVKMRAKPGMSALIALSALVVFKILVGPLLLGQSYSDGLAAMAVFYGLPLIAALFLVGFYTRIPTFASIVGLVLAFAEFIDFGWGIINNVMIGTSTGFSLVIWTLFRLNIIAYLLSSYLSIRNHSIEQK